MKLANRLSAFQSNVFAVMDHAKQLAKDKGLELIDLSLGSSDLPVAPHILQEIERSLHDPQTHGYLLFHETRPFREAVAQWYEQRFGLAVDPETEVLALVGSQEGTGHLPLAVMNPGDYALLLDPGYPSHAGGVYLAGGQIHPMPLLAEHQFLPQFANIPAEVVARSRLMVLSYPHNPTTAVAPRSFFEEALDFCDRHDIVLVHDFPYVDLVFDPNVNPPSLLQADRDRRRSIEFFTFSKSHNMGGFRLGYAIGNADLIRGLRQVKSIIDFNQYRGILAGGILALQQTDDIQYTVARFRDRRDHFVQALQKAGWPITPPTATMYVWAPLPEPWQHSSVQFCQDLVAQTGIAASPGAGFGPAGEGYVRFALVQEPDVLSYAVDRIAGFLHNHA